MELLESLDRQLLTVTLNRPEALNALTQMLMRRLVRVLDAAAIDPAVEAVLLGGAGRAFCAGGDRKRSRVPDPDDKLAATWSEDPAWGEPEMRFDRLRANVRAVGFCQRSRQAPAARPLARRGPGSL